jgi:hypothetical protein
MIFLMSAMCALTPAQAFPQVGAGAEASYDRHLAPASTLLALSNEMRHLDGLLRAIHLRPEYPGLEREASFIRDSVRTLDERVREHLEGRHETEVGGTAEVNWLRQRILLLRRDIERLPPVRSTRPGRPAHFSSGIPAVARTSTDISVSMSVATPRPRPFSLAL